MRNILFNIDVTTQNQADFAAAGFLLTIFRSHLSICHSDEERNNSSKCNPFNSLIKTFIHNY